MLHGTTNATTTTIPQDEKHYSAYVKAYDYLQKFYQEKLKATNSSLEPRKEQIYVNVIEAQLEIAFADLTSEMQQSKVAEWQLRYAQAQVPVKKSVGKKSVASRVTLQLIPSFMNLLALCESSALLKSFVAHDWPLYTTSNSKGKKQLHESVVLYCLEYGSATFLFNEQVTQILKANVEAISKQLAEFPIILAYATSNQLQCNTARMMILSGTYLNELTTRDVRAGWPILNCMRQKKSLGYYVNGGDEQMRIMLDAMVDAAITVLKKLVFLTQVSSDVDKREMYQRDLVEMQQQLNIFLDIDHIQREQQEKKRQLGKVNRNARAGSSVLKKLQTSASETLTVAVSTMDIQRIFGEDAVVVKPKQLSFQLQLPKNRFNVKDYLEERIKLVSGYVMGDSRQLTAITGEAESYRQHMITILKIVDKALIIWKLADKANNNKIKMLLSSYFDFSTKDQLFFANLLLRLYPEYTQHQAVMNLLKCKIVLHENKEVAVPIDTETEENQLTDLESEELTSKRKLDTVIMACKTITKIVIVDDVPEDEDSAELLDDSPQANKAEEIYERWRTYLRSEINYLTLCKSGLQLLFSVPAPNRPSYLEHLIDFAEEIGDYDLFQWLQVVLVHFRHNKESSLVPLAIIIKIQTREAIERIVPCIVEFIKLPNDTDADLLTEFRDQLTTEDSLAGFVLWRALLRSDFSLQLLASVFQSITRHKIKVSKLVELITATLTRDTDSIHFTEVTKKLTNEEYDQHVNKVLLEMVRVPLSFLQVFSDDILTVLPLADFVASFAKVEIARYQERIVAYYTHLASEIRLGNNDAECNFEKLLDAYFVLFQMTKMAAPRVSAEQKEIISQLLNFLRSCFVVRPASLSMLKKYADQYCANAAVVLDLFKDNVITDQSIDHLADLLGRVTPAKPNSRKKGKKKKKRAAKKSQLNSKHTSESAIRNYDANSSPVSAADLSSNDAASEAEEKESEEDFVDRLSDLLVDDIDLMNTKMPLSPELSPSLPTSTVTAEFMPSSLSPQSHAAEIPDEAHASSVSESHANRKSRRARRHKTRKKPEVYDESSTQGSPIVTANTIVTNSSPAGTISPSIATTNTTNEASSQSYSVSSGSLGCEPTRGGIDTLRIQHLLIKAAVIHEMETSSKSSVVASSVDTSVRNDGLEQFRKNINECLIAVRQFVVATHYESAILADYIRLLTEIANLLAQLPEQHGIVLSLKTITATELSDLNFTQQMAVCCHQIAEAVVTIEQSEKISQELAHFCECLQSCYPWHDLHDVEAQWCNQIVSNWLPANAIPYLHGSRVLTSMGNDYDYHVTVADYEHVEQWIATLLTQYPGSCLVFETEGARRAREAAEKKHDVRNRKVQLRLPNNDVVLMDFTFSKKTPNVALAHSHLLSVTGAYYHLREHRTLIPSGGLLDAQHRQLTVMNMTELFELTASYAHASEPQKSATARELATKLAFMLRMHAHPKFAEYAVDANFIEYCSMANSQAILHIALKQLWTKPDLDFVALHLLLHNHLPSLLYPSGSVYLPAVAYVQLLEQRLRATSLAVIGGYETSVQYLALAYLQLWICSNGNNTLAIMNHGYRILAKPFAGKLVQLLQECCDAYYAVGNQNRYSQAALNIIEISDIRGFFMRQRLAYQQPLLPMPSPQVNPPAVFNAGGYFPFWQSTVDTHCAMAPAMQSSHFYQPK